MLVGLLTLPSIAWADHFEQTVSIHCDHTANQLVIEHHGAYDESGDQLLHDIHENQWNVRTLIPGDKNGIAETWKTVKRDCTLRNDSYEVSISGITWGKYGSDQSAHIIITSGKKTLFDGDLDGSPFSAPVPTVTRIIVSDGDEKPHVLTTTSNPY
jgi:hypothetical protein